jgi:hypothetical protein
MLGRNIRLSTLRAKIGTLALVCAKAPRTFRHPFPLLLHYVRSTSPANRTIELQNGWKLFLSRHEHDLITAMTIFCRLDYGRIARESTVIDIGANVGFFSLYAAYGAQKESMPSSPARRRTNAW